MKKVSIIMVNLNGCEFMGKKYLKAAIESFLRTDYKNFEFIFVDNNSWDDSIDFVKNIFKRYPKISTKIAKNDKNLGFAGGCEKGFECAEGDYIVLVNNDDKVIRRDWLKPLMRVLNSNKKIGMTFSKKLKWDNPRIIDSTCFTISPMGFVTIIGQNEEDVGQYDDIKESLIWQTPVLFRKELIKKLGGFFDLDYAPLSGHDDTDSSIRIWQQGYKILLVPNSVVLHKRSGTMKHLGKELNIFHGRKNILQTMLKDYEFKNLIRYTSITILLYILSVPYYILVKRNHQAKGTIKALFWIFVNSPKIIRKRFKTQSIRKVEDKKYFTHCARINLLDIFNRRKKEALDEV